MGKVDSPINAKPPVPEECLNASALASSLKAPIATTRKLPEANKLTVARLRLRRRVQPLTPNPATVSRPAVALRPSRPKSAAENPSPATRNRLPALKKVTASAVSFLASAHPTRPKATVAAPTPTQRLRGIACDEVEIKRAASPLTPALSPLRGEGGDSGIAAAF